MLDEESAHRNAVCVFLSDTLSLGLALLKWMLILKLGAHREEGVMVVSFLLLVVDRYRKLC